MRGVRGWGGVMGWSGVRRWGGVMGWGGVRRWGVVSEWGEGGVGSLGWSERIVEWSGVDSIFIA